MKWWAAYVALTAIGLCQGCTVGVGRLIYWIWYYADFKTGPRSDDRREGYWWGLGVAWLMWKSWYWRPFWWSYDVESKR